MQTPSLKVLIPLLFIAGFIIFFINNQFRNKETEQTTSPTSQPVYSEPPPSFPVYTQPAPAEKYFVFGAIHYSYERYPEREHAILTSEIIELLYKPSKDDEYRLLDQLSGSSEIRFKTGLRIHTRKSYTSNSYAEASEKRQEVLANGI